MKDQYQRERQVVKEIVKMALVNGLTLTKQHTKGIGLAHKNKDKELRLGLMDIFIKVSLKIVCGVERVFWPFQTVQLIMGNGPMGLWMEREHLHGPMEKKKKEFGKMANFKNR